MKKWLALLFAVVIIYNGCNENPFGKSTNQTETGNPVTGEVNIAFSDYTTQKVTTASVSSIAMCFKRIRFKAMDENSEDANDIELAVGQITLNPAGTFLTELDVPEGNYNRIEFDLEEDCEGNGSSSVIVDNDNDAGTPFETTESVKIRFEGSFTVDEGGDNLILNIGNIVNIMDTVTNASQIKTLLEDDSATGSIDDTD